MTAPDTTTAQQSDHDRLEAMCLRDKFTPIPRCGLCDRTFVAVRAWEHHIRTMHPVIETLREAHG